jgi:hypothetical protein
VLNSNFMPTPDQRRAFEGLPEELQRQGDRLNRLMPRLPALVKSLRDAGITVTPG